MNPSSIPADSCCSGYGGHGAYGQYAGCGVEGFHGSSAGPYDRQRACSQYRPFWGEQACSVMPRHCGGGSCGHWDPDGQFKQDQQRFETYDGAIGAYAADAAPVAGPFSGSEQQYAPDAHTYGPNEIALPTGDESGGCAEYDYAAQHQPGCDCIKCAMPYSAPYHAGPGCGKEDWCRCVGDCKCGGSGRLAKVGSQVKGMLPRSIPSELTSMRNLVVGGLVAAATYWMLQRK